MFLNVRKYTFYLYFHNIMYYIIMDEQVHIKTNDFSTKQCISTHEEK